MKYRRFKVSAPRIIDIQAAADPVAASSSLALTALRAAAPLNSQLSTINRSALQQIILPSARDRWQSASIRSYTPDTIEQTLRTALTGDLQSVWLLFDLMEDTWPRLVKNLNELKDDVASADLTVQAWSLRGEKPNTEAQNRAKLFEQAIWSMRPRPEADENDLRGTIKDLLDAWGKGISILEIDWALATLNSQPSTVGATVGVITPRSTRWIHPRYYGYPFDSADLRLNTMEIQSGAAFAHRGSSSQLSTLSPQLSGSGQWAPFPPNKFLIGIAKARSGHPSGAALLRALAWWWCASNFAAEWFLNFAQIFGLPIRWANYDASKPGLLTQICDMLENMGSAGWGAFPAGTTIELKEPSKGSDSLPQAALLDRADRQCDLLILGQTLTSDVGDSGSRALGEVHEGVLTGRKKSAAEWVAAILSYQLAPAFCRLNFGDDKECPWVMPATEAEEKPLEMAQRDKIFLDAGIEMDKQWFFDRHGLPVPAAGAEVITGRVQTAAPDGSPGERPSSGAERSDYSGRAGLFRAAAARDGRAPDATDKLTDRVLEDLTGVEAKWLGGVKPFFRSLVTAALNTELSDQDFLLVIAKAQREMPELFDKLNHDALAAAMEAAMGSALVNGAVKGSLRRRLPQ